MKKIFILLPMFAAVLMTGCSSDDIEENVQPTPVKDFVSLTADISFDDDSRITYQESDRTIHWETTDEIAMVGANGTKTAIYKIDEILKGGLSAKLSPKEEDAGLTEDEFPAEAFYPASLANKVLPEVQQYNGDNLSAVNAMYTTYAKGQTNAMFSNICGLLRVNVLGSYSGDYLKEIRIEANQALSGAFTLKEVTTPQPTGKFIAEMADDAKKYLTLNCVSAEHPYGIELSTTEAKSFYITLPANTYTGMKITAVSGDDATGNYVRTMKADKSLEIARNTRYNMPVTVTFEQDILLPGVFTVDADGHKVQFTRGNLYWDGTKFGLEKNQYSFNNSTSFEPNYVSHFYFTKLASNAYASSYKCDWEYNVDPNLIFCFGALDRGTRTDANFNVYGKTDLRILTGMAPNNLNPGEWDNRPNEWDYLFNTDRMTKQTGTKFAYTSIGASTTIIDGIECTNGVFIYPDDYIGVEIGKNGAPTTWVEINSLGIVFLPAIGTRNGTSISSILGYCRYLASAGRSKVQQSRTLDNFTELHKASGTAKPQTKICTTSYGLGVRLVKDVTAPDLDGETGTEVWIEDED